MFIDRDPRLFLHSQMLPLPVGRSGISLIFVTVSAAEIVDHRPQADAQDCHSAGFRLRAST
jgi:hypothetical protein